MATFTQNVEDKTSYGVASDDSPRNSMLELPLTSPSPRWSQQILDLPSETLLHESLIEPQAKNKSLVWDHLDWYPVTGLLGTTGLCFSFFFIKLLSETVSIFQILTIRSTVSLVLILLVGRAKNISFTKPKNKLQFFIARGILGSLSLICATLAYSLLPLSEAAFLTESYPVVTAVLSYCLGMENLRWWSWLGVVGCLVGNALVARIPFLSGEHSDWGAKRIVGIIAAVGVNCLKATMFIVLKFIGREVNSIVPTCYLHGFVVIFSFPLLMAGIPKSMNWNHSPKEIAYYVMTWFGGAVGQLLRSRAAQTGPPTKVTSLFLFNIILSGILGVAILSESLYLVEILGSVVIFSSVLLVQLQKS